MCFLFSIVGLVLSCYIPFTSIIVMLHVNHYYIDHIIVHSYIDHYYIYLYRLNYHIDHHFLWYLMIIASCLWPSESSMFREDVELAIAQLNAPYKASKKSGASGKRWAKPGVSLFPYILYIYIYTYYYFTYICIYIICYIYNTLCIRY